MDRATLRKIGIYIVVILALLRLAAVSLGNSIDAKKEVIRENYDTYRAKAALIERYRNKGSGTVKIPEAQKDAVLNRLYASGLKQENIQAEALKNLLKIAEKNRMDVVNFEILDIAHGRTVSEIPFVLRLKGQPKAMLEMLGEIEKSDKIFSIKIFEASKMGQDFTLNMTVSVFGVGNVSE